MNRTIILDVHSEGRVVIQKTTQEPSEVYKLKSSKILRLVHVLDKPIKNLQKIKDEQLMWLIKVATIDSKPHFGSAFKVEQFTLVGE